MVQTPSNIISASRRTDIPGWYTPWFLDRIQQGFFTIKNPYNGKMRRVDVRPEEVHSIVFWSKNFGPFIEGGHGQALAAMGYNLFFNFTVNSDDALLEPRVPPLKERLRQLDIYAFLNEGSDDHEDDEKDEKDETGEHAMSARHQHQ